MARVATVVQGGKQKSYSVLLCKVNDKSGQSLIQARVSPPSDKTGKQDPVVSFILLERYNAVKLVQNVHASLASLSKVIRGTQLLTKEVMDLAQALMAQESPQSWLSKWDGPEDPLLYLRGLVTRAASTQSWVEKAESGRLLNDTLDLSDLFHPDTFLNALRQQTARELKQPMDSLKFVCSWKGNIQGARVSVRVDGIQLEGCAFDGTRLSENQRDSPSFTQIPPCAVAWIPKDAPEPYVTSESISLPVYASDARDRVVANFIIPCGGSQDQWLQSGAALFLKTQ